MASPTYTSATSLSQKDSRRVKCYFSVPVMSRGCEKALLLMLTGVNPSAYPIAVGPGTQNLTTSITMAYRKHFRPPDSSGDQRTFGQSYKSWAPLMTYSFQVFLPPGRRYNQNPFFVRVGDHYVDIAKEIGFGEEYVSRGIAIADVDLDGALDLIVSNMWGP